MTRERTRNDLCTPTWITTTITEEIGRIDLDPCSNDWSQVPAHTKWSIDRGEDGLARSWSENAMGLVFCNPPYGRGHLKAWAGKCVTEADNGVEIILLVPCSPDTNWWHGCLMNVRAISYLHRRIAFDGGAHGSGTFASALLYWGHRPHLFLHAFSVCGDGRLVR